MICQVLLHNKRFESGTLFSSLGKFLLPLRSDEVVDVVSLNDFLVSSNRSDTRFSFREALIKSGMQITQTDFPQAEAAPRIARK